MCDFLFWCCGVLLYVESVWPANLAETGETRPTRSLSNPRTYTYTWASSCGQGSWYGYAILLSVLGNVLHVPKMVLMTSTGEWVVTYNVLIALMCALEM